MILIPSILFILLLLISPIYLAAQKNFLFIPNQNRNSYAIRLLFLIPGTTGLLIGYCFFVWSFFILFFTNFSDSMYNIFGYYSLLPLPLLGSFLLILLIKKYVLRKDRPSEFQPDFLNYDLYIYMPSIREIDDSISFQNPRNYSSQSIATQVQDIILDYKDLSKEDILFTKYGELVATIFASSIFEKNNLTGYQHRPTLEKETMTVSNIYTQLISFPISPLSSSTKFKTGTLPYRILVKDDQIYYNSSILNEVSDFNRSSEYFGSNDGLPYLQQKFWIVTNKAMNILINELNQNKRDFIPIHLVDDEI
jgi:hypothetical protein